MISSECQTGLQNPVSTARLSAQMHLLCINPLLPLVVQGRSVMKYICQLYIAAICSLVPIMFQMYAVSN